MSDARGSVDVDKEAGGMANQLDLANTYIEMDDEENAKLILKDIIASDNEEAKADALAMLEKLNGE